MLQSVSARNVYMHEDEAVGGFKNFCQRVKAENDQEIIATRVSRFQQRSDQQYQR